MSCDKKPNEPISKEEWQDVAWQWASMIAYDEHPKQDIKAAKALPEARKGTYIYPFPLHSVRADWLFSFVDDDGYTKEIIWNGERWMKAKVDNIWIPDLIE